MPALRLFVCLSIAALLGACASSPSSTRTETRKAITPTTTDKVPLDPAAYLELAENAWQQGERGTAVHQWLIAAANGFADAESCQQAEKVLYFVTPELTSRALDSEAAIISAECLLRAAEPEWDRLPPLLDRIQPTAEFNNRIRHIRQAWYQHEQRWTDAAVQWLQMDKASALNLQNVWELVNRLSYRELERARQQVPILRPWADLALLIRRDGLDPEAFALGVTRFQQRYPEHPLTSNLPAEVTLALALPAADYSRIAVLLPLTGRLASQGQAIKEGMLAAYFAQRPADEPENSAATPQLVFFDSNREDLIALAATLTEFDALIGPLLKDQIAALIPLLPADFPVLALNRIEQQGALAAEEQPASEKPVDESPAVRQSTPFADTAKLAELSAGPTVLQRFFFALAPEDEASQLADSVWRSGARRPIIIADDNPTTRRMAETFEARWLVNADDTRQRPPTAFFDDNKAMRIAVLEQLDVAQSKARIEQIERLITPELHAVPRNRRDIDAIVLFANNEQTKLLNPIIEASLSPFIEEHPAVYAASRSYSRELSDNELRDLRSLTFTDMPWMLPNPPWPELYETTEALWPNRNDTLRRLFALGYDSVRLLDKVARLKTLPYLTTNSLTGQLSVAKNGDIMRQLPLGVIDGEEVKVIATE